MSTFEGTSKPDGDAVVKSRKKVVVPRTAINSNPMHFSWNKLPPRLVLTADTPDFDPTTIEHFKAEGFGVIYLPYNGDAKAYRLSLAHLADPLELGDTYGIVAYGEAAAHCLDACIKPVPKLVSLIAFYPDRLPTVSSAFPPSLRVQIHLAGSQKLRTQRPVFTYHDAKPGFAEEDLDEFDKVSARMAWSRVLGCLRRSFGGKLDEVDLERIWDEHCALEFVEKDASKTMTTMIKDPYVNHVPVMTGGVGHEDVERFYNEFFIPGTPEDFKMKTLSRTIGTDRIVDEFHVQFTHDHEFSWMLPGVPPTGKKVEVAAVSIVCIRGGKLYHEHIYWDQASVLLQVGLLDPRLVPKTFQTKEKGKEREVRRIPVLGAEAARKVLDEEDGESNQLLPGWRA